ncbi:MAG: hypothetical protein HC933_10765 [Pleurocapsa sp. SU_196_0]|nr:hypothetical protein [Pleurocapsa sp. SU_196_0]
MRALDRKEKIVNMELNELRSKLNAQILAGKYNTPLGEISFDSEGEIIQKKLLRCPNQNEPRWPHRFIRIPALKPRRRSRGALSRPFSFCRLR